MSVYKIIDLLSHLQKMFVYCCRQVPARLPSLLDVGLHTSRCDDEFAEICVLGAGGYGKVHKVTEIVQYLAN